MAFASRLNVTARQLMRASVPKAIVLPQTQTAVASRLVALNVRLASTHSSTSASAAEPLPDYLLKFKNSHTAREVYHYTSYALAAGVPLAVYMGEPLSTLVDLGMTVILPLHLHIGMRSILVDYVHTPENQKAALVVLAFFTVVTTLALVKLNFFDVGLTQALKEIFTQQTSTGEKETEKDVFAHLSPKK